MMRKSWFRLAGLVSAVLLISIAGAGMADAGVPGKMIGYARVGNPDGLISGVEKFTQGLDLPPMATMVMKMGLGGLIENPNLVGVDMAGPLCLVSFSPDAADAWGVCFTLSNPDVYLGVLNKSLKLKSEDEKSGIKVYAKETKEFDLDAYQAASPEEQSNTDKFYRTEEKTVAVAIKDKTAWLSLDPAILKDVQSLTPADFAAPVEGALVIGLKVQPLLDVAEEGLREKLDSLYMGTPDTGSPFGPEIAKQMARSYVDFYLYYARQVETVVFGLTVDGTGVTVEKLVEAKPGSTLAKFLMAQKKGKLSLARYLQPSPWMVVAGRIEKPEMVLKIYRRLFDVFDGVITELGSAGGEKDISGKLAAFKDTYLGLMETYFTRCAGDEMAFSLSSSPDAFISAVSLQKIRDRKAYGEYIAGSFLENHDLLALFYERLGITMDVSGIEKPVLYKGADIYTARMTIDFKKLLKKESFTGDEQRVFAIMAAPIVMQMAATDDLAVTEMSWGGESDIKARLDLIAAGKSSFDTDQLGTPWQNANGVVYFSINRYLKNLLGSMIQKAAPEGVGTPQAEVFEALGKLDLPLVTYLTADGATLKAVTAVPMDKILAVKAVIEELKSKMPAAPAPTSGGTPVPAAAE
ncbi:MAG: hypothetical protein V1789_07315 [PVC group bacterium]